MDECRLLRWLGPVGSNGGQSRAIEWIHAFHPYISIEEQQEQNKGVSPLWQLIIPSYWQALTLAGEENFGKKPIINCQQQPKVVKNGKMPSPSHSISDRKRLSSL